MGQEVRWTWPSILMKGVQVQASMCMKLKSLFCRHGCVNYLSRLFVSSSVSVEHLVKNKNKINNILFFIFL